MSLCPSKSSDPAWKDIIACLCGAHCNAKHLVENSGANMVTLGRGCQPTCIVSRSCKDGSLAAQDKPRS